VIFILTSEIAVVTPAETTWQNIDQTADARRFLI
jgi:hypothetical protein